MKIIQLKKNYPFDLVYPIRDKRRNKKSHTCTHNQYSVSVSTPILMHTLNIFISLFLHKASLPWAVPPDPGILYPHTQYNPLELEARTSNLSTSSVWRLVFWPCIFSYMSFVYSLIITTHIQCVVLDAIRFMYRGKPEPENQSCYVSHTSSSSSLYCTLYSVPVVVCVVLVLCPYTFYSILHLQANSRHRTHIILRLRFLHSDKTIRELTTTSSLYSYIHASVIHRQPIRNLKPHTHYIPRIRIVFSS